jgi:hypothetical protein
MRPDDPNAEPFAGFQGPKHRAPVATEFRSTWLASSLRALRERHLLESYFAALTPAYSDIVRSSIAGAWLPIDVAIAHYHACDGLGLSTLDQLAIGAEVTRFAQTTSFGLTLRIATEMGVTPWACFQVQQRLWRAVWRGGDVSVFRLGPREARVEILGWPCSAIAYCRIAMRGMLNAQTALFCRKSYVAEVSSLCTASTLGYRVAWA